MRALAMILALMAAFFSKLEARAEVSAAQVLGVSIPAPPGTAEKKVFQYRTAHFGFCARGAPCKNGERWLEEAIAHEGHWLVPQAVSDEQVLGHYQKTLKSLGWTILNVQSDAETRTYALAATKNEKSLVRGLDIVLRNSTPADTPDARLRVIEYWEGVGRPLGKNHVPAPQR